jgi:CHAD domain-containing protein
VADQGNPSADKRPEALVAAAIEAQRKALHAVLDAPKARLKPKVVHELRVAIRRLLTALELANAMGQSVEPRTLRRLHKLLSRLSPARDAHVLMRSLTPLLVQRPEVKLVIAALRQRRRRATRKAKKHLAAFDRAHFDHDTTVVLEALASPLGPSAAVVRPALLGELARRHLNVERRQRGMAASDPAELHRVRVLLKEYRYALEATLPLLPDAAVRLARQCETLQEELGKAHDAHVLAETTRELGKSAAGHDARSLLDLAAELEKAGQVAHEAGTRALAALQLDWPL